jgi:hypothetical protein
MGLLRTSGHGSGLDSGRGGGTGEAGAVMSRWLLLLTCLLAAPAWAEDWRDTLTPPQPGRFPPPRPFKSVYHFGWSGIVAAQASFDFSKASRTQYQLAMKTQTTGLVRTLWKMDSLHTACCTASTLRPVRLEQTEVYKSKTEMTKAEFSAEGARRTTRVTPSKEPPDKEHRFKCANVFDLQTALLFIRSQRLQAGDHYRLVVFPAKSAYLADIEVLGREKLKVPAGSYDAVKCQVRLQEVNKHLELEPHAKFKRAYAWLSDDRDRLLLKIEAEIFVGSVWAELQSVELTQ